MEEIPNFATRGTGFPFVFQHGLGSRIAQPQSLLDGLEMFTLISVDCPGHGQSPLPPASLPSFDRYTDQVTGVLDQLQIESAFWGGISMGAGISLNAALRFQDRVEALVLVRPAWLDKENPANLKILIEAAELIPVDGGREKFEKSQQFTSIRNSLPDAARSVLGVFAPEQRKELPLVLRSMVGDRPFESKAQLEHLQLPVLVIGNDDDPLHPFAMAEELSEAIPGSRLEKVVSRYVNNQEHGRQVREIVSNFLTPLIHHPA